MKVQVSFDGQCKVWEAASTDKYRPVLATIKVEYAFERWIMVATDNYILAMVPVELDPEPAEDWSVLLPANVVYEVAKAQKYREGTSFTVDQEFEEGKLFIRYGNDAKIVPVEEGTYPDWQVIVPEQKLLDEGNACDLPFDFKKLSSLASAIGAGTGTGYMRLRQAEQHAPIVVTPITRENNTPVGIIMPVQKYP